LNVAVYEVGSASLNDLIVDPSAVLPLFRTFRNGREACRSHMKMAPSRAAVGSGESSHYLSLDMATGSSFRLGVSHKAANRCLQATPCKQGSHCLG
ncbi:hypothetical protein JRQ81_018842, partial [Phrynocephalus forsythii]